jgi:methionyl-tRNA synthetase
MVTINYVLERCQALLKRLSFEWFPTTLRKNFLAGEPSDIFKTDFVSKEERMITIEEFRKLDLRIATIQKVEPHPNADKLLVLQIDLGEEQRQIVAGIRNHYVPEDLVGRQIVVVSNLEPAKLRGAESQGMLLAASDGDRIIILTPEKKVTPGAKVS